jgi:hypothetical protein
MLSSVASEHFPDFFVTCFVAFLPKHCAADERVHRSFTSFVGYLREFLPIGVVVFGLLLSAIWLVVLGVTFVKVATFLI